MMLNFKSTKSLLFLISIVFYLSSVSLSQSTTATLTGSVSDEKDAGVPGATVKVINTDAGFERTVTTSENGTFSVPLLPPATYRVTVERSGFAPFEVSDIVLNANDQKSLSLRLKVGQASATVNVTTEGNLVDVSPGVSTAIDRQFINNLPLNGRSLQTLIALSPGVVAVPTSTNSQGQFSVNGQRGNSNYFTVDGMSGNFSVTNFEGIGQNASGSIPTTSITGGFSSLASVEELQEFSIQTSTFAAEFGRSPGGQITLVTRSGDNNYHGSLFEYVRNDKFDARDFFDTTKPPLRFNNFGGSFGGPVVLPWFGEGTPYLWHGKDKTFFFFTYEGQRFVLPQPAINTTVPSLASRNNAPNEIARSILNGFPIPNGADITNTAGALTGGALFTTSYSNPSNLDSWSLKIDHNLTKNFRIYGRYHYAPSNSNVRDRSNPSQYQVLAQNAKTLTLGSTQVFASKFVNETSVNYSHNDGIGSFVFDGYGGGVLPSASILLPASTAGLLTRVTFNPITNITSGGITIGDVVRNEQRQIQLVDNISYAIGTHQIKFGGDHRWLSPITAPMDVVAATAGMTLTSLYANVSPVFLAIRQAKFVSEFKTFSFYGQDTWKINKGMTLTYGFRWEINPSPTGRGGKVPLTFATAPDLSVLDQSSLQLAPIGTPYYQTGYTNFAPRIGAAYQVSDTVGRELVVRGGFGMFYDLGQVGFGAVSFPYSSTRISFSAPLPIESSFVTFPAPNFTPSPSNRGAITVAAPDYTLPRTYQWNLTAEQSLGKHQAISVGYVGALGQKLVRVRTVNFATSSATPNVFFSPNFSTATVVDNGAESSYHSLQTQFTRRLSKGLQAIASYTWSHSIDNASNDSGFPSPGYIFPQDAYRGNSDFDVRHIFNGAVTYVIPTPKLNRFSEAILGGWSLNSVFAARSGLPFTPTIVESGSPVGGSPAFRRPGLTGAPLWIADPTLATGQKLNPAAFNFNITPGQMGDLGRNVLRGPAFWQIDMGLHRNFGITEKLKLQLRVEAFNILNHSNFLYPRVITATRVFSTGVVTVPSTFGIISQSAARGYGGGGNTGGFNPLFQSGGPRSMQFGMRLSF